MLRVLLSLHDVYMALILMQHYDGDRWRKIACTTLWLSILLQALHIADHLVLICRIEFGGVFVYFSALCKLCREAMTVVDGSGRARVDVNHISTQD
jgi:hypothetical protein